MPDETDHAAWRSLLDDAWNYDPDMVLDWLTDKMNRGEVKFAREEL